jgi:hypothetical protein
MPIAIVFIMAGGAVVLLLECYLLTIDFRQFLGALFQLFLLALLLALSHDELVGADALVDEIDVQQD